MDPLKRMNGTLQDRLVKERRLAGLHDLESENRFLSDSLAGFNRKFERPAASGLDAHRPVPRNLNPKNWIALGGTGYQPVAPGYQPGAPAHRARGGTTHKKVRLGFDRPRGKLPRGTGKLPVPPNSCPRPTQ